LHQYGSSRVGDATTDLFDHKLRGIVDIFDGVKKRKNGEMNLQSSGNALFIPCHVRRFFLLAGWDVGRRVRVCFL